MFNFYVNCRVSPLSNTEGMFYGKIATMNKVQILDYAPCCIIGYTTDFRMKRVRKTKPQFEQLTGVKVRFDNGINVTFMTEEISETIFNNLPNKIEA